MIGLLVLVFAWVFWCALHSLLISLPVTTRVQRRFPEGVRYYRIFFNITAVVTLVPVLLLAEYLRGPVLFDWNAGLRAVQALMILAALFFFAAGARRYDLPQFLGIRQALAENSCSVLTDDCSLDISGVLGVVRHPWYTGGILIVWARPLDAAAITTNLVVSAYFVVGAYLEEKKLEKQFGRAYADYQAAVSMFLPFKWIRRRVFGE